MQNDLRLALDALCLIANEQRRRLESIAELRSGPGLDGRMHLLWRTLEERLVTVLFPPSASSPAQGVADTRELFQRALILYSNAWMDRGRAWDAWTQRDRDQSDQRVIRMRDDLLRLFDEARTPTPTGEHVL